LGNQKKETIKGKLPGHQNPPWSLKILGKGGVGGRGTQVGNGLFRVWRRVDPHRSATCAAVGKKGQAVAKLRIFF